MAEPEDLELDEEEESSAQRWKKRILQWLGCIVFLLGVVAAGFFAGIYLRIFDVHDINEKIDLYAIPFIGENFVKPVQKMIDEKLAEKPPEKPPEGEPTEPEAKPENGKKDETKPEQPKPIPPQEQSKPIVLTKEEIERQQKEEEAAEKKRVSKLARLYNEMKPEAAADIMAGLDDDIAIAVLQKMDEAQAAKVLAALNPTQSARFTRSIYSGKRSSMYSPGDRSAIRPLRQVEEDDEEEE